MTTAHADKAYVTLVTKPSYLVGAIILAYSLKYCRSTFPLLILVTPGLGDEAITILELEAKKNPMIQVRQITPLTPREENIGSAAARFADTYTKLRAFQLHEYSYTKCVFLDADMAVFQTPDELFDVQLPDKTWIGANHACVCNLDFDSFAPPDWNKGNCAYTPLNSPHDPPTRVTPDARPTYHLLNSGMFVFEPHQELWDAMMREFETSDKIKSYAFPDQDFMADFFRNRWQSLSWKYNALKTMRSWHPRMYKDEDVVVLHYIVDKPWERRIASDKIAGHLGRDGFTHQQWWDIYEHWKRERCSLRDHESATIVSFMRDLLPRPLTGEANMAQIKDNMKFDALHGGKTAIKPFGTPPGEASDISDYFPEDRQAHPYDNDFPPSPSQISQQFDEAAGLALESLLRRSSVVSSDPLTEPEVKEPITPDADPEQYTTAALLYWFHKAQTLEEENGNLRHLTKVLESETSNLRRRLQMTPMLGRHRLPSMRIPKPVFYFGDPTSDESDSEMEPAKTNKRPRRETLHLELGLDDLTQHPAAFRSTDTRRRYLKAATSQPSSDEEHMRFRQERLSWAADPDEVDRIPPEERVDNVLGHTRKLSGRAGFLEPLAESSAHRGRHAQSSHVRFGTVSTVGTGGSNDSSDDDERSGPIIRTGGTNTPLQFAFSPETAHALDETHNTEPFEPSRSSERGLLSPSRRSSRSISSMAPMALSAETSILPACPNVDTMEESTELLWTGNLSQRVVETEGSGGEHDKGPLADTVVKHRAEYENVRVGHRTEEPSGSTSGRRKTRAQSTTSSEGKDEHGGVRLE